MTNITIPDEAVEAAYMSFTTNLHDSWRDELRAAIAAAINAWPGRYSLAGNDSAVIRDIAAIILSIPQEPQLSAPK